MRQHQASEYNEVSESARKVDCLFMYEGLELSNIEFKRPDTSVRDLAIQNRKNVRLGRCIQEAHIAVGVEEPSVMMADVAGFVGIFYQVKKMGDIAIAGKTTSTTVTLPQEAGSFDRFLEDGSLAILWNFISHLEKQGRKVLRAKQRYDAMSRSTKFVQSVTRSSNVSKPTVERKFENNVTLSPPKRRASNGVIRIESPPGLEDSEGHLSLMEEILKPNIYTHGDYERFLGEYISSKRSQCVVATNWHHSLGILAEGFLTGKHTREQIDQNSKRHGRINGHIKSDKNWRILDEVKAIAKECNRTPAQVTVNWTLQKPGITSPLIGARTMEQFEDNLGALEFKLTEKQMARLDAASNPSELPFPNDLASNSAMFIGHGLNIEMPKEFYALQNLRTSTD
ncbi:hypothetical protein BGX21_003515 [Mortierella sp. AD011]|nr:hypothetical protein BGX21_003515 [Mortierella sp. AD011]